MVKGKKKSAGDGSGNSEVLDEVPSGSAPSLSVGAPVLEDRVGPNKDVLGYLDVIEQNARLARDASRPKFFGYLVRSVRKLKGPFSILLLCAGIVGVDSTFRTLSDLYRENKTLRDRVELVELKNETLEGQLASVTKDATNYDEKIVSSGDATKFGEERSVKAVILGERKLKEISRTAVLDGSYTKIALIDIIKGLYKAYYDDSRMEHGDSIKIIRGYLDPVLRSNAKFYEERGISPVADLDKFDDLSLYKTEGISKKSRKKERVNGFSINCSKASTQEIPNCFGCSIVVPDKVRGYITHEFGRDKEKIRINLFTKGLRFVPSGFVNTATLGAARDFDIDIADIEKGKDGYIGSLYGKDKHGKKIGLEYNLTTCAISSVRFLKY